MYAKVQGSALMRAQGYIVVAAHYSGLGGPARHPYRVGISEGCAVRDSVRAARQLPEVRPTPRFAVWGHSQGRQAAQVRAGAAVKWMGARFADTTPPNHCALRTPVR